MRKYILQVCNYAAPYEGNFMASLLELEKSLNQKDIGVVYLFPNRALNTKAKEWIECLRSKGEDIYIQESSFLSNYKLIKKICKQYKIKTVIRHFDDPKVDLIFKLIGGMKIFRFFHGMPIKTKSKFKQACFNILYKRNICIGVSSAVSAKIKEVYPKNSIVTIENAIYFPRLQEIEDDFEKSPNISFLTMGYNFYVKGIDLTLEALKQIKEEYDIVLNIAVASHKEELIDGIKKLYGEIPEWIHLLAPTNKIATYYKNVDFFLSPSRSEGFCYAIVEAAYCKATIIASKIPAQGDLLVDNVYWFESENVTSYIAAIKNAISNRLEDMGKKEAISKKVQERYSLERWTIEVETLLSTEKVI